MVGVAGMTKRIEKAANDTKLSLNVGVIVSAVALLIAVVALVVAIRR